MDTKRKGFTLGSVELALFLLKVTVVGILISYLFYQSILAIPFLLFLLPNSYKREKERLKKKKDEELKIGFKDAILSLLTNIQAGYSVENAFNQVRTQMEELYGNESEIAKEIQLICKKVATNQPVESAIQAFADRKGIEEILDFAKVFGIGKRIGGDMHEVIKETASLINEKIVIDAEITTQISAKEFELKIMNCMPFALIFYIRTTSEGYFDPLYSNTGGVLIMTVCLLVLLMAKKWGDSILKIKI